MSVDLSVRLSADAACRELASVLARRYAELVGGRAAEAEALGQAVAAAADGVSHDDHPIDLVFTRNGAGVEVDVSCADRRRRCRAGFGGR